MSYTRQVDWDTARALHPRLNLIPAAALDANRERGFGGEAYTCDSGGPADFLFVQRTPFGEGTRADMYLEAGTVSAADALLGALDPTQQYFMSYPTTYPWRHVVERRLVGSRIWGKFHYRLEEATFTPRPQADACRIEADDEVLRSYRDELDDQTIRAVATSGTEAYPCFGVFDAGRLVAVACRLAHNVSWVHTQTECRKMGRGSAVVSAATASILSRYEFATYDADTDNAASIGLCGALGYELVSETVLWAGTPARQTDSG